AATGVTLSGACETGLSVAISGTGVSAASSVACSNSAYSSAITFSSGDGTKTVQVAQTDAAGNNTTISRSFTRASTAPPPFDGAAFYTQNCSGCHGAL